MKHALRNSARRLRLAASVLALSMVAAALFAAWAQYPGRINTKKNSGQTLRSIAVLEWIGQPGKPSASRIIPVAVYDGETYQPGGLYLARPEPLAVETGTEYVLEQGGIAKGLFDVNTSQNLDGYWFGYGSWKKLAPPPPVHKLRPAKVMPRIEGAGDSDRPHFVRPDTGTAGSASSQSGAQGAPASTSPPADPDRPVLRRRSTDSTEDSSDKANTAAGNQNPDFLPPGPETPLGGADPDRPRLTRGAQDPTDKDFTPAKLSGTPSGLEQMVAVSDASDQSPHPFTYFWASPGDAVKMQAQMETLAEQATALEAPPKPAAKPHQAPSRTARTRKPVPPPLPTLGDESFHAFALSEGAGATLVFSAQATRADGTVKYVTLIAQPDFYGALHVIFKTVTDDSQLEVTPRLRLVDAVDATANGRGELLFEARSKEDRQFVLYQIVGDRVDQVFTTGSLPTSPS